MATVRRTSKRRGQKINAPHVSTLQGELLPLEKEDDGYAQGHFFFVFLFYFSHFHPFTTNVT
jgi:hypothetical protein